MSELCMAKDVAEEEMQVHLQIMQVCHCQVLPPSFIASS
jgi:hypothetical protein